MNETSTDTATPVDKRRSIQVSIIIVNWKSVDYTHQCIRSVIDRTSGITYEIIVIDGASGDGCGEMIKTHFPDVVFIQSATNDGFARANNRAYKQSNGQCLLFLNPDTEILGSAIRGLYQQLIGLDDAGAVGCKLLNGDGSIQTSCIQATPTVLNQMLDAAWLRRRFPLSTLWGMAPLFRHPPSTEDVAVISGACMMVKRAVFEEVGLFSTDYFMYAEDVDLCVKLIKSGYRNYYLPEASVYHFGGGSSQNATSDFSTRMKRESIWRFFVKTRGPLYALAYRLSMGVSSLLRLIILFPPVCLGSALRGRHSYLNSLKKWMIVLQWAISHKTR